MVSCMEVVHYIAFILNLSRVVTGKSVLSRCLFQCFTLDQWVVNEELFLTCSLKSMIAAVCVFAFIVIIICVSCWIFLLICGYILVYYVYFIFVCNLEDIVLQIFIFLCVLSVVIDCHFPSLSFVASFWIFYLVFSWNI
jgi:hypothetical protein